MRSTEPSGVDNEGFGGPWAGSTAEPPPANRTQPFPTLATALTLVAILAAATSIWLDFDGTRRAQQARQSAIMHLALDEAAMAALVEEGTELAGVWQRGGIAMLFAGLVVGLAWRRRPAATTPQPIGLDTVLASIPFGVACWTRAGELITCNEQYRARLKLHQVEVGQAYPRTVRELSRHGYMQLLRDSDNNRLIELHRDDGACLLMDERPLGPDAFITLISDVTETRRTDQLLASIREEQRLLARRYHEEKLRAEAANRAKTTFLAHLSHDIRTPLNHIIGFAELMRQQTYGALGDARYLNYVEAMKSSGERLLSYFASILELAELDSGRRPPRLERIAVDDLLLAATRRHSAAASKAGLILQLGPRCGVSILADRPALDRMLGNLVDNAVRFTPAGGRISLAAYAATDGVVLEVTDTGIGIPPNRLDMLSQPFSFADSMLTREQHGAGLGIAIARAIAEQNGGRLAIDSEERLGTTVAVSLPLQPAGELPQGIAAAA